MSSRVTLGCMIRGPSSEKERIRRENETNEITQPQEKAINEGGRQTSSTRGEQMSQSFYSDELIVRRTPAGRFVSKGGEARKMSGDIKRGRQNEILERMMRKR